jgi:hypothetical protein
MEIENNWAPPTIGDIRLPDRDLGRRLSHQPSVEMRAKMLGLDWTTLTAARTRLLAGAWLISIAVALVAIVSDLGHASLLLTTVVVAVAVAVVTSILALRSVSRLPVLIARNHASTAKRYSGLAKLSPSQSLLGYRVRWILVRHAVTVVITVALVALMARGF